jgi:hypothetical protein
MRKPTDKQRLQRHVLNAIESLDKEVEIYEALIKRKDTIILQFEQNVGNMKYHLNILHVALDK